MTPLILFLLLFQDYTPIAVKNSYVRVNSKPKVVYVVHNPTGNILGVCPDYVKAVNLIHKQANSHEYSNYTRTNLKALFPNTKKGNADLSLAVLNKGC